MPGAKNSLGFCKGGASAALVERRSVLATFSTQRLCARQERHPKYRGARTDHLRPISNAATSTVGDDPIRSRRQFRVTRKRSSQTGAATAADAVRDRIRKVHKQASHLRALRRSRTACPNSVLASRGKTHWTFLGQSQPSVGFTLPIDFGSLILSPAALLFALPGMPILAHAGLFTSPIRRTSPR